MYTPKSSIIVPTSEARMRLMEQKRYESQYSSSLEANIINLQDPPIKQTLLSGINQSIEVTERESSKNNTAAKNSPASLKNKKLATANIDNLSIESTTSSNKEKKTLKVSSNPFEDDGYDVSKDPFANDDEDDPRDKLNPFENDSD